MPISTNNYVDVDKLVQDFHYKHDVSYELRLVIDGEVKVKRTSGVSADDVVMYADAIDEAMQQYVIEEEEGRQELENQAAEDALREEEREQ